MSRYIDADALLNHLPDDLPYKASVKRVLIQAPTADVVEVKHGNFIIRDVKGLETEVRCSVCNSKDYYPNKISWMIRYPNYCSDCGAKMDGERREDTDGT